MRVTEATPAADPRRDPLTINCGLVEPILVGFVRSEVRRVGFKKAVLGLSGGIDSTLSAYIAAKALGPENVCGVRMPYSTSSTETMDHGALVAERARHPDDDRPDPRAGRRLFRPLPRRHPAPPRQQDGPRADDDPLRPVGRAGRPGHRHEQQDRAADRLRHDPRRHGLGPQPDRRPLQDPGPRPLGPHGRPRRRSSTSTRPPTSGSARPTRPNWASPTPRSTASSPGSSTSAPAPTS